MSETEEILKKKKGRPRKQKNDDVVGQTLDNQNVEVEKKKRGRKKKEVGVEEVKQKKKRGRKAAVKYFSSSIRKKIPLTTVIQDNNNYILHLDIKQDAQPSNESQSKDALENTFDKLSISEVDNATSIKPIVESTSDVNKFNIDNDMSSFDCSNSCSLVRDVDKVKKEIQEMLINDQSILSDFLEDPTSNEKSLRELYEKRIEYRENQDKLLVDKLESLHKDDEIMNKLLWQSDNDQCQDKCIEDERKKTQELNRKKGYFELLYTFVHNAEWLDKTDVCCWWCCHPFEGIPIGLPVEYVHRVKKFMVKGIFCSFACMIAYKNDKKIANKDHLVKYLYAKLTGEPLNSTTVNSAPLRCTLKMFGGELSIEEFRKSSHEQTVYKMVEYPMFIAKGYVEEIDIANVKNVNTKLFDDTSFTRAVNLDEKRVNDAKMRLSQIEKTTITLGNTIDKFINIS